MQKYKILAVGKGKKNVEKEKIINLLLCLRSSVHIENRTILWQCKDKL